MPGLAWMLAFGDDGSNRPSPAQMALLAAINNREEEIRQEMAKHLQCVKGEMIEAFKKMDKDGNGFLSKDEIKGVLESNAQKWGHIDDDIFDKADENKDGNISIEEFMKFALQDSEQL